MTKLQGMKRLIAEVCATACALATGQTLAGPPKSSPLKVKDIANICQIFVPPKSFSFRVKDIANICKIFVPPKSSPLKVKDIANI